MTYLKLNFLKGNRLRLRYYRLFHDNDLTEKILVSKFLLDRVKDQLALQEPRL